MSEPLIIRNGDSYNLDTRADELKPCKHCGGEAKFQIFDTTCNVECQQCGIGTRNELLDNYQVCVYKWNRSADDNLNADITSLKSAEISLMPDMDERGADSREKLEADMENMVRSWCADDTSVKATRGVIMFWQVKELLDRQAAITCRECAEKRDGQNWHETVRQDELSDTRERLERCLRVFLGLCVDEEPDPTTSGIYYNIIGLLDRQGAITTAYCTSEDESCCEACRAALKRKIAELTAERDRYEVLAVNAEHWKDERDQLSLDLEAEHALLCQFEDDNERMREALKAFELNQMYSLYKQACMDRDEWRSKYEALRYNKEKVWCDCDCCNWRDERERLTDEVESLKRANRIQAESFRKLELQAGKDG